LILTLLTMDYDSGLEVLNGYITIYSFNTGL